MKKQRCEICGLKGGTLWPIIIPEKGTQFNAHEKCAAEWYKQNVWNTPASTVSGIGPDAPLEENEHGARQSKSPYRFDLIDPKAAFALTELLAHGAEKYGVDNWRKIPVESHLNHMLVHAYAFLAGDTSDDHLTHMLGRALFAVGVHLQEDKACEKQ